MQFLHRFSTASPFLSRSLPLSLSLYPPISLPPSFPSLVTLFSFLFLLTSLFPSLSLSLFHSFSLSLSLSMALSFSHSLPLPPSPLSPSPSLPLYLSLLSLSLPPNVCSNSLF
uniref:Uncharacterized protein n=1 Tax=Cacopsylla melanoneura TaxID=428564 RepID=A0A8D9B1H4_9HEMI